MRSVVLILVACAMPAGVAVAQAATAPPTAAGNPAEAAPVEANAPPPPPASQPVGSLLLARQPVPLTPPSFQSTAPPPRREDRDEGMLVDLQGRLVRQGESGWFILEPIGESSAQYPQPFRVLPSGELEVLEHLAGEDSSTVFHVTGQRTSYKQDAYILVQTVMSGGIGLPGGAGPVEAGPTAQAGQRPPATSEPPARSVQDIMRSLTRDRPPRPVEISAAPQPAEGPPEGAGAGREEADQSPAGGMIVDRTVRVVPSADRGWLEAHFVADNNLQERPLLLLPCRLLERAEKIEGKMRVTGIIRRYKGRDYLLLRKVLAERAMGQL